MQGVVPLNRLLSKSPLSRRPTPNNDVESLRANECQNDRHDLQVTNRPGIPKEDSTVIIQPVRTYDPRLCANATGRQCFLCITANDGADTNPRNRKHHCKHTRPFVCHEPTCERVPGFTYSGGLLRHQREVHQYHGGPKKLPCCPYKDCERGMSRPFTRLTNLKDHLRRKHGDPPIGSNVLPSSVTTISKSSINQVQKKLEFEVAERATVE